MYTSYIIFSRKNFREVRLVYLMEPSGSYKVCWTLCYVVGINGCSKCISLYCHIIQLEYWYHIGGVSSYVFEI